MVYFNLTVYCNLQGRYEDLSIVYNLSFAILFMLTGLCVTLLSGYVIWKGFVTSETLRKRPNTFVLSLVFSDFLFGVLFVPTFVVELFERVFRFQGDFCLVRSWRVLLFSYLFSCRLLSIFFISIYTYIRTCHNRTKLEAHFTQTIRWLTIIIVWITPAVVLFTLPTTQPESYKTVGTVTYVYYFVSISVIFISYILTYSAIRKARSRGDPSYYEDAVNFVKGILVWFLITTLLIATCGLVLVILSHGDKQRDSPLRSSHDVIEHHLYIGAILICTLDALANPIVYMRKFKHLKLKTSRQNQRQGNREVGFQLNEGFEWHSPQSTPVTNYNDRLQLKM